MPHASRALLLGVLLAACGDPKGTAGAISAPKQPMDPSKMDRTVPREPRSGLHLDDKTGDVRPQPVEQNKVQ